MGRGKLKTQTGICFGAEAGVGGVGRAGVVTDLCMKARRDRDRSSSPGSEHLQYSYNMAEVCASPARTACEMLVGRGTRTRVFFRFKWTAMKGSPIAFKWVA